MLDYNWVCQVCGSTVEAGNQFCSNCGCPAKVSAKDIENYKIKSGEIEKIKIRYPIPNWIVLGGFATVMGLGVLANRIQSPVIETLTILLIPVVAILFFINCWRTFKFIYQRLFLNDQSKDGTTDGRT